MSEETNPRRIPTIIPKTTAAPNATLVGALIVFSPPVRRGPSSPEPSSQRPSSRRPSSPEPQRLLRRSLLRSGLLRGAFFAAAFFAGAFFAATFLAGAFFAAAFFAGARRRSGLLRGGLLRPGPRGAAFFRWREILPDPPSFQRRPRLNPWWSHGNLNVKQLFCVRLKVGPVQLAVRILH